MLVNNELAHTLLTQFTHSQLLELYSRDNMGLYVSMGD